MPSARMRRPVPSTIFGMTRCAVISGAAPKESRCSRPGPVVCLFGMSLTYRIPANASAPEELNPGCCQRTIRSRFGRCWRMRITLTLPCPSPVRSTRSHRSRRWPIGVSTGETSSTALTVRIFRSTMNSTSGLPSGKPPLPASPTAFKRAVDWNRSFSGRTSPRCLTGTHPQLWQSLAKQSAKFQARCCAKSKRLSDKWKGV